MDSVTVNSGDPAVDIDSHEQEVDVDSGYSEVYVDHSEEAVEVGGNGMVSQDYNTLANKPAINHTELVGDKSLGEIGLSRITNARIRDIVERSFT